MEKEIGQKHSGIIFKLRDTHSNIVQSLPFSIISLWCPKKSTLVRGHNENTVEVVICVIWSSLKKRHFEISYSEMGGKHTHLLHYAHLSITAMEYTKQGVWNLKWHSYVSNWSLGLIWQILSKVTPKYNRRAYLTDFGISQIKLEL